MKKNTTDEPKPDDLKKNHPELNPDKGKVVTIVLDPDDHFDNTPSELRKRPRNDGHE